MVINSDMRKQFPVGTYIGSYYNGEQAFTVSQVVGHRYDASPNSTKIVDIRHLAGKHQKGGWKKGYFNNNGEASLWNHDVCKRGENPKKETRGHGGCYFKIPKNSPIIKEFTNFIMK